MNEEEIRKAIQEKWNELSYEFAVNRTEDGKFTMTDICDAFYEGINTALRLTNNNIY